MSDICSCHYDLLESELISKGVEHLPVQENLRSLTHTWQQLKIRPPQGIAVTSAHCMVLEEAAAFI